jgi:hypothetical protein
MPQLTPIELCIANLRGDFPPNSIGYKSIDDAIVELKKRTGMDFGLDANKWKIWLENNPQELKTIVVTIEEARIAAKRLKPK